MAVDGKVSIIVPYYNSVRYIDSLLESVIGQSYLDFECILVDDGGRDGTFEHIEAVLKGDTRFRNIRREGRFLPGGRGAKNQGYSISDGEFVVFFDSDDVMHPDYLLHRVEYLKTNPGKGGVVSDFGWRVKPKETKRVYRYNRRLFDDFMKNVHEDWFWLNYMDYRFWFNPGNPMWRRSAIDDKPLWDETTSIGEDHEYHARLMLSGLDIGIIDGVHWDYMANSDSMITTSESIKPLLSRSYGKMLVTEHILGRFGVRPKLLRKELTWQVKILRRVMACESDPEEKMKAVETMFERIGRVMSLMGYRRLKSGLLLRALRTIVELDARTGKGHSLYSLVVRDTEPTSEFELFRIS